MNKMFIVFVIIFIAAITWYAFYSGITIKDLLSIEPNISSTQYQVNYSFNYTNYTVSKNPYNISYSTELYSLEAQICSKAIKEGKPYELYGKSCIPNNITDLPYDCICYA